MSEVQFEWDEGKNLKNIEKHQVSFHEARKVFEDSRRITAIDLKHSKKEERMYCIGMVEEKIITVRYTYRKNIIRIIGAGYWRQGKKIYEKENS